MIRFGARNSLDLIENISVDRFFVLKRENLKNLLFKSIDIALMK